ncbi:alpha/beta hydrolase [Butyrivibrio sp. WCE2006]|uniref:alpha/beta hydrolase n=1 Tax=Butyrivibrio sp. WCE2006 TaxID=1410611 RepID=UPI0005D152B2|nr:alpha/beta hydrolase [Butyrivibrio sp. WCE2006]
MSKKRNFVFLGLFAVLMGGGAAAASIFYNMAVVPKKKTQEEIDSSPVDSEAIKWLRSLPSREDVYINSIDGLKLHAHLIKADTDSHKYAICIHGINSDGEFMSMYAKHYHDMGINVLLPDNRGYGLSEGDYTGYGYFDRLDIMEWIYYITHMDKDAHILIHGTSMGAAITLMTTGEKLPDNVVFAVADSSYTTLSEEFAAVYKSFNAFIPVSVALFILRFLILIRCGYDINKIDVLKAVSKSKTPTLFIHGDEDKLIDPQMCSRLYEKCTAPKQYCLILGADHVAGAYVDPDKYWNKVDSLMEKTGY